jgi:hypothetical protein
LVLRLAAVVEAVELMDPESIQMRQVVLAVGQAVQVQVLT